MAMEVKLTLPIAMHTNFIELSDNIICKYVITDYQE
jgi:hypothetical protein